MVICYDAKGRPAWFEPPYTKEELERLDRAANAGVVAFSRLSPRPVAAPAPEQPQEQQ
jgi:hypothetical protein